VENRFKELSSIIPYDLILINTYKVNHDKAVESSIHKHYKESKVRREWFKLNKEDLIEIDRLIPIFDVNNYNRIRCTPKINLKYGSLKELMIKIEELERKYRRTKGIKDIRRVIGNELRLSDGNISKLKKINKLNPFLFDEIEKGHMTINSAFLSL
jgi:hypothetical protein